MTVCVHQTPELIPPRHWKSIGRRVRPREVAARRCQGAGRQSEPAAASCRNDSLNWPALGRPQTVTASVHAPTPQRRHRRGVAASRRRSAPERGDPNIAVRGLVCRPPQTRTGPDPDQRPAPAAAGRNGTAHQACSCDTGHAGGEGVREHVVQGGSNLAVFSWCRCTCPTRRPASC